MELDRQRPRPWRPEHLLRLLDREGDALAEAVDRIGEPCCMRGRQGLLRDEPHIAGAIVAVFRREGMGAEKRRRDLDRQASPEIARHLQHLELGLDIEPVARLDLDRRDALGEEIFQPLGGRSEEAPPRSPRASP